ncbi:MAG: hypothetical protein JXK93_00985 [Sphaerochaetaceae bacterium]|nr:hypothetical protein [Sphaerochaetaceae bacterium]
MTTLELYNIALSVLDKEITQTQLDSTTPIKEVRLCNRYYPLAVLKAIREFDWSFLIVRIEGLVGTFSEEGYMGFSYEYTLPEDLFKVVWAFSEFPYEVVGGKLYCSEEDPVVYGIMKTLPETGVPEDFYELIAYTLAYQIAPLLAPEGKLDQIALQKYTWALSGLISAECHNNSREVVDG